LLLVVLPGEELLLRRLRGQLFLECQVHLFGSWSVTLLYVLSIGVEVEEGLQGEIRVFS